jgi:SAM-dependent methyltransferase
VLVAQQSVGRDRGPRPLSTSKIAAIIREMGWRSAVAGTALFAARMLRLWWWDRTHRVTTRHRLALSALDIAGPVAEHAQFYEGSDTKCLPRLLGRLTIPYAEYVFIDIGTGKGTPLFLAADFPFKRVVGLEASPALADLARRNCATFRSNRQACHDIDVLCEDAAEFTFPDAPLVIYMFNPFDGVVLSQVLANLERSLRLHPRDAFLIYYNPSHAAVLDRSSAFTLLFEGADAWDYRRLHYKVYRASR